jgi:hypothetical protein
MIKLNAVADAAARDLLAQPHHEHGAARKRGDSGDQEEQARIRHQTLGVLQAHGDAEGLEQRQHQSQIASVLVELLAAGLAALFPQLFPRRIHRAHQLHDDGRRDVGRDVQGEDRHPLHGAAREHVEHAQDAAGLALEGGAEGVGVDAGNGDVGADSVDQQRAQGEQDRLCSSVARWNAPKFMFAASCSAAEAMAYSRGTRTDVARHIANGGPACEAAARKVLRLARLRPGAGACGSG